MEVAGTDRSISGEPIMYVPEAMATSSAGLYEDDVANKRSASVADGPGLKRNAQAVESRNGRVTDGGTDVIQEPYQRHEGSLVDLASGADRQYTHALPEPGHGRIVLEYGFEAFGRNRRQVRAVVIERDSFQIADQVVGVSELQVPDGGAVLLQFAPYPGKGRFPAPPLGEPFLPLALPSRKPQRDQVDDNPPKRSRPRIRNVIHRSAPAAFEYRNNNCCLWNTAGRFLSGLGSPPELLSPGVRTARRDLLQRYPLPPARVVRSIYAS